MAERDGVDVEQAFATLRNHARNHNLLLADVARDVIAVSWPRPPSMVRPSADWT